MPLPETNPAQIDLDFVRRLFNEEVITTLQLIPTQKWSTLESFSQLKDPEMKILTLSVNGKTRDEIVTMLKEKETIVRLSISRIYDRSLRTIDGVAEKMHKNIRPDEVALILVENQLFGPNPLAFKHKP